MTTTAVVPRRRITIERALLILTAVGAVAQFVFSLGVNWSGVATREQVAVIERAIKEDYVRRDVYLANQENLVRAIERLNTTLDDINRERRAEAGTYQPPRGRQFDR